MAGRRTQVPDVYAGVHADYAAALADTPLDAATRRAYDSRVRVYLVWLEGVWLEGAADISGHGALSDPRVRDVAVNDYKIHLTGVLGRSDNTVNAHLTALDRFYEHLGLGKVGVDRAPAPRVAPRALTAPEQQRYLRAVQRRTLSRDRAIGHLLLRCGLLVSELVALDTADVPPPTGTGTVDVGSGAGGLPRQIPLTDIAARAEVAAWQQDRLTWPGADTSALLLNRRGGRLSARAVDLLLDDISLDAGLSDDGAPTVSANVLRHTFATNLLNRGIDIVTVAEQLGHARLDTTRRYTGHPHRPQSARTRPPAPPSAAPT
ncbi:hypothetical protein GCM10023085_25040 [Actinomadura viridis]|uniref:Integrase/recombinase XerC n=1 Tax=Actinomadura viridis TaxID=58110 RepID=A0A931DD54_9ACTN|nr:tyrosine-type recombinase/integrase [Actinomadura viridis]MBG6088874.1 integrase/recombinase XerC [Actinomadura viridis]